MGCVQSGPYSDLGHTSPLHMEPEKVTQRTGFQTDSPALCLACGQPAEVTRGLTGLQKSSSHGRDRKGHGWRGSGLGVWPVGRPSPAGMGERSRAEHRGQGIWRHEVGQTAQGLACTQEPPELARVSGGWGGLCAEGRRAGRSSDQHPCFLCPAQELVVAAPLPSDGQQQ